MNLLHLLPFLVLILFFVGFFAGRNSIFRQNLGEAKVADAISSNLPEPFHLFNNITLKTTNGTTQIDLGKFEILGQAYKPREYWALLGRLDNANSPSAIASIVGESMDKGNFSAKIRNRCYQLRFMRALVNAYNSKMITQGKGEAQLCMLLVALYYLAAKMKMKDSDLQGPFYKVA